MKKVIQIIVVFGSLIMAQASFALDPVYTSFFSNKAIKGYDTVAYFTQGKPVKGSSDYQTDYQGAQWLFSSQSNLDLFLAEPEKYAPQYGGYCAWAVSQNSTASIRPDLFTIVNGKLYLNYSDKINDRWLKDQTALIEQADKHWPELLND